MSKKKLLILSLLILGLMSAKFVFAQTGNKITFTITPPLIKINLNPGETWSSTVKIVNNNTEVLSIYTDALDFKSKSDGGIEFLPKDETGAASTSQYLSRWIDVKQGPIDIEPFTSYEIPFVIRVPDNADPGGHYAAILAGTRPIVETPGSGMAISSLLSSLVMINVKGDIIEKGTIREFSSDKAVYDNEQVRFKVKFENKGNVHLLPRGDIIIEDMFGKKRETININHKTEFGNVLPSSSRSWNFEYSPETGPLDMGRYSAMLTMSYGNIGSTADANVLYFWVLNIKLLMIVGGSILGFILIFYILVKLSIRSAIKRARKQAELFSAQSNEYTPREPISTPPAKKRVIQRLNNSGGNEVVDLKNIKK